MVFVEAVARTETHNLTLRINRIRPTAWVRGHGPAVGDWPVFPKSRVARLIPFQVRTADNLAGIVDPGCGGVIPPQRTEIRQRRGFVPGPKERMIRLVLCHVREANHLATIVHPVWNAQGTAETANVHHFPVLPKEWIQGGNASRGVGCEAGKELACNLSALIHKTSRAVGAAQGPHILHAPSFSPAKRVCLGCCWGNEETLSECATVQRAVRERIGNILERAPRHLAAVIYPVGNALGSTQGSKVDDAFLP